MTEGLGLGDAYGATLGRIKGQGGEKARLGMAALMWISHAERPLKSDELCHALAVEIGSPNLNADNVPSIGTLLACCQGLVVVEKKSSTIRLIHFTLLEYLRAHPDLFGTAHSTIAEICLGYLNSRQVKAFSTTPSPDLQDTPFLEYSSLYWGVHAKRHLTDCAKQLALMLFDDYNRHISIKILLITQQMYWHPNDFDEPSHFNGLHCASFFGIVEIVASLVETKSYDINQMGFRGYTSLHWAAARGHEGAVKILLGRDDVSPDEPNNYGETPLFMAARNGHEGAVKTLLGRDDVDPNKANRQGLTPFLLAACFGHAGVVKILLARNSINPDKDSSLGAPLYNAALHGHEGVVKTLLGRGDVDPNKHNDGETPLYVAAWGGHEGVVKILLERADVTPDISRNDGITPLHISATNGLVGVVKLLLKRDDVNPNNLDKDGKTPLDRATEGGHQGVIALLQPREPATPSLS